MHGAGIEHLALDCAYRGNFGPTKRMALEDEYSLKDVREKMRVYIV
jgi:hypothetical protein